MSCVCVSQKYSWNISLCLRVLFSLNTTIPQAIQFFLLSFSLVYSLLSIRQGDFQLNACRCQHTEMQYVCVHMCKGAKVQACVYMYKECLLIINHLNYRYSYITICF